MAYGKLSFYNSNSGIVHHLWPVSPHGQLVYIGRMHQFRHDLWMSPRAAPLTTPEDDARAAPVARCRDVQANILVTLPLRKRAGAALGGLAGASIVAGDHNRTRDAGPLHVEMVRTIPTRKSIPARSPKQSKDLWLLM